jgi:uncharacterized protein (DUF58 family)
VRLTAVGRFVAALSVLALVAAYVLGYQRLAGPGIGGLVALGIGIGWVARRPPVTMTREIFPSRVTRGEPAVGMLSMRNASRWFGSRLEARERFGETELAIPVPYLSAGANRQIGYELPTTQRGIIEVGPLRWEKSDALGLVRRQHALAGQELLYVHPRAHQFPLSAALRAQRWDSSTSDAAPDGTITFHTLREYVPGDDLRFIHWRSSAKLDTLLVRRNIDVSLPMTTMLLVTGRGAYPSADLFEEAVEIAASTVVAAARERLPARLLTSNGQRLASAGGHDDAGRFLDFLAGVRLSDETGLGPAAERLERSESGGILVVATGSVQADDLVTLRQIAARYDDVVVALLGPVTRPEAGPATPDSIQADLAVTLLPVQTAAQFCARWGDLASR